MQIKLSPAMREWVEEQILAVDTLRPMSFILDLLRKEKRRRLRKQIEGNLLDALHSGPSTPMTAADWDRIRSVGNKRLAARRRNS